MKPSELGYLEDTYKLIQSPLADEPELMKRQLRERYGRVGYCYRLLAISHAELDHAECQQLEVLQRQNQKLSAYEKEVMIKAAVSPQRQVRDEIAGVIKTIESESMLGMSIIKDNRRLPIE